MAFEHEPGTVWKAQELYCVDRLSFDKVATLTGVAASTLKRWADTYRWREKREEIAQAESDIRINTIRARKSVLDKLLQAEGGKEASQVAFAVASLESLAMKQQELAAQGKIAARTEAAPVTIATVDDAAAVLKQAVEGRLAHLLAGPEGVTLAAVKEVIACLDMMAKYTRQDAAAAAPTALSAESAQALREALGI